MYLCPKSALFAFVYNKLDHKARDETKHVIGFVYIKWVFEYLTAFNWSVTRISAQKCFTCLCINKLDHKARDKTKHVIVKLFPLITLP